MRKILSLILAVIFTVGCLCVPTVSAAEADTVLPVWKVDPTTMSSATDNGGSESYTLSASSDTAVKLADVSLGKYSGKALYIKDGQYNINDTGAVLDNYPALSSAEIFILTHSQVVLTQVRA